MTPLINAIYSNNSVTSSTGEVIKLQAQVTKSEGDMMVGLIAGDPTIRNTLEIGFAYGLSSLYICEALKGRTGARHTLIDPFQNSYWKGVGVKHLKEAGVEFFQLIEEKSEFALPRLTETSSGTYDFILVDGMHTFDHALLDIFYCTRLLRVGGLLVIDDADKPSLAKVLAYVGQYPCYLEVAKVNVCRSRLRSIIRDVLSAPFLKPFLPTCLTDWARHFSMVALKKIANDERRYDWYAGF